MDMTNFHFSWPVYYVLHLTWPRGHVEHFADRCRRSEAEGNVIRHWHMTREPRIRACLAKGGRLDLTGFVPTHEKRIATNLNAEMIHERVCTCAEGANRCSTTPHTPTIC